MKKQKSILAIIFIVLMLTLQYIPVTVEASSIKVTNIDVPTSIGKYIRLKPTIKNPKWTIGNKNLVDFNISTCVFKSIASGKTTITAKGKNKVERFYINIQVKKSSKGRLFNHAVKGSTVWPVIDSKLYKKSSLKGRYSYIIKSLEKGIVKKTKGDAFYIHFSKKDGWINSKYLMINLPDIRSDIKYNITNAYSSIFKIGGKENKSQIKSYNSYQTKSTAYTKGSVKIKNITKKRLYTYDYDNKKDGKVYNKKLKKYEFVCPVLYTFAKKICQAQNCALKNGYSLKVYDGYRPQNICNSFWKNSNETVKASKKANFLTSSRVSGNGTCYTNGYTNLTCFVAKSFSDHAGGYAIDVTLVYKSSGKEITSQSHMHDLSSNSVKWVNKGNKKSWGTNGTDILNSIMKNVGMKPLAFEWWHFSCPALNVGYGYKNIKI